MKHEVYNQNSDRWVTVPPKIYKFLTQARGYRGRKVKPAIAKENPVVEDGDREPV